MKKLISVILSMLIVISALGTVPTLAESDYFEIEDVLVAENWQIGQYHWETGVYDATNTERACLKKLVKVDYNKFYLLNATNADGLAFALREYDANKNFIKSTGTVNFGLTYQPSSSNVIYISITMYDGSPLSKIQDGTIVPSMQVSESGEVKRPTFLDVFKSNSTLAWNDEFEGDKVDETKWEIAKGWGRVEETWGTQEDGNVTVSDGCLKLRAYQKATSEVTNGKANNKMIQSGEVSSKAAWSEGLIEVRAKLPKGKGVYPAIWTMGRDYSINSCLWPQSGEIDIMEAVGGNNNDKSNCSTWQTLHTARPYTMNSGSGGHVAIGLGEYKTPYEVPLNDEFHTFWGYMDGSIMIVGVDEYMMNIKDLNDPNLACFKDWEQWLVLGLQMGGLASSPERTDYSVWEMLIDYVRVYRLEDIKDYSKYQIFEAENLEPSNRVTVNYMPSAQKCPVAMSADMNLYLKDIESGNYDVYIDYVGTANDGSFVAYFNGQKANTILLKRDYNAQMKYQKVGSITVEEKTDFQLKFKRASGTLYLDKVFLVKTDNQSEIVLNNANSITTSNYIEVANEEELISALSRIKKGGTIKFLDDIELTKNLNLHHEMNFDLNGKTLRINKSVFYVIIKNEVITFKNGNVEILDGSSGFINTNEENSATKLNVQNVNFTVNTSKSGYLFNDYYSAIDLKCNNCTFNFSDATNNLKLIKGAPTFNNCTFNVNGKNVFLVANNKNWQFNSCVVNDAPMLFSSESALTGGKVTIANTTINNLGALTNFEENLQFISIADGNTLCDADGSICSPEFDMSGDFTMSCEHSYNDATCTKISSCMYCAKEIGEKPAGHISDNGTVTRQANCYYSEITTYSCTECGEVLKEKETAPIKGHEYKFELLGENTCTTMRYYKYSCENCDYYYMDGADTDISGAYTFKGHTVDESTKVEFSSCVNHVGYYYTCAECGKENCKYIEHIGTHDIYSTNFTAPTETTAGSVTYKCNDCDYSKSKTIKAGEHIVTVDGVKYFTVDGAYYTPYQYASDFLCYVDQNAKEYGSDELIMLESDLTLSKVTLTEHVHIATQGKDVIVAPTCAKQGYTEHLCSICKNTYTDTFTQKLPHNEVVDKGYAPTCTEKGLTDGLHCGMCSQVLVEQIELDPLGHKEVVTIKGVAPTCTLSGILDEIKCETCGITLQERAFAPAKGHEYKEIVTKEPTCGKAGVKTYKCECGHSYTESIPKTNAHSYKWVVTKKATYFAKGTKSYKCSCGKVAKTTSITQLKLKKPTVTYKAMAKKISVKYTKVTGATGFQVRYRLTTSKSWKTVNFKTSKSATKYIKSLKKNKKYYLQTRAYVQSGSKKAYSSWTTRKTIKVK